jgi:hypothetical protein
MQANRGSEKNMPCLIDFICLCNQSSFNFSLSPLMTAKTCSGGLVLFGSLGQNVVKNITTLIKNAYLATKTYNARKQHTGPERDGGEDGYKWGCTIPM